jgi:hypothetical protein
VSALFFDDNLYPPVLEATQRCVVGGPGHIFSLRSAGDSGCRHPLASENVAYILSAFHSNFIIGVGTSHEIGVTGYIYFAPGFFPLPDEIRDIAVS